MPDEGFTPTNIHYGVMSGGVLKPVGEVGEPASLTVDGDADSSWSYYHELTDDLSGTITLKIPWHQQNRVARMLGYRAPYLVARLNRGKKSHRGKETRCHAT